MNNNVTRNRLYKISEDIFNLCTSRTSLSTQTYIKRFDTQAGLLFVIEFNNSNNVIIAFNPWELYTQGYKNNNNSGILPFANRMLDYTEKIYNSELMGLLQQSKYTSYCNNTQLAFCLYNVAKKWPK